VVYARIWTKTDGAWRYSDSTFSGAVMTARITYPPNGSTTADAARPIAWTSVANAQAYYLYVGTVAGAKDLVNTGEIQTTSAMAANLPSDQTVHARLWTKVGGIWRHADSSFSVHPLATLLYPPDGGASIDQSRPASWTSVSGAQAYYLYIGLTPGARDVLDSRETSLTSFPITGLPSARPLFARLWAKTAGVWGYRDSSFSAGPLAPEFVYPRNRAIDVDVARPFQWIPPPGAQAHRLLVGSSPGADDLLDSGELAEPTYTAIGLPSGATMYARVWSKVDGHWTRRSDIVFASGGCGCGAVMVAPGHGGGYFDARQPFQWTAAPLADRYRLRIGTSPGAGDLHDSGEISVTRRFVSGLPVGVPLFGRLETRLGGEWSTDNFTFTPSHDGLAQAIRVESALWAADFVRTMAPADHRPYGWTPLLTAIAPRYKALCSDYAALLLQVLVEMNVGLPARRLDVSFNGTNNDAHTLVELQDPTSLRWVILDPTFDLAARNPDGSWAAAEDISLAASTGNWTTISYVYAGPEGDAHARGYYLDYPLLFVNVYRQGQTTVPGQGQPIAAYLNEAALPTDGASQAYVVQCQQSATTRVLVDGLERTMACTGADATSPVFWASSVALPEGSESWFRLYRVPRFVF
jgi:hypothetical protein